MRPASALALLVVGAVPAGRALFGPRSITVHGVAGDATFASAAASAVVAAAARAGRHPVAVALAVVLAARIGLRSVRAGQRRSGHLAHPPRRARRRARRPPTGAPRPSPRRA